MAAFFSDRLIRFFHNLAAKDAGLKLLMCAGHGTFSKGYDESAYPIKATVSQNAGRNMCQKAWRFVIRLNAFVL